jgi:hypothetical protein
MSPVNNNTVGTSIIITDPNSFEVLKQGDAGMILISGPQVMQMLANIKGWSFLLRKYKRKNVAVPSKIVALCSVTNLPIP